MNTAACSSCRFGAPGNDRSVNCRRFPKAETKKPDDWCGEHQHKFTQDTDEWRDSRRQEQPR